MSWFFCLWAYENSTLRLHIFVFIYGYLLCDIFDVESLFLFILKSVWQCGMYKYVATSNLIDWIWEHIVKNVKPSAHERNLAKTLQRFVARWSFARPNDHINPIRSCTNSWFTMLSQALRSQDFETERVHTQNILALV